MLILKYGGWTLMSIDNVAISANVLRGIGHSLMFGGFVDDPKETDRF